MITSLSEVNVYYYATMFVSALTSLDIGMFIFFNKRSYNIPFLAVFS